LSVTSFLNPIVQTGRRVSILTVAGGAKVQPLSIIARAIQLTVIHQEAEKDSQTAKTGATETDNTGSTSSKNAENAPIPAEPVLNIPKVIEVGGVVEPIYTGYNFTEARHQHKLINGLINVEGPLRKVTLDPIDIKSTVI
jgi:hypothetical protein